MHHLMCFEKDNVKIEEIVNHVPRLGIGIRGRSKKNPKNTLTAFLKSSSAIKYEALNHRTLLKFIPQKCMTSTSFPEIIDVNVAAIRIIYAEFQHHSEVDCSKWRNLT